MADLRHEFEYYVKKTSAKLYEFTEGERIINKEILVIKEKIESLISGQEQLSLLKTSKESFDMLKSEFREFSGIDHIGKSKTLFLPMF